ncbi:hypothetical protein O206_19850 [Ochrobactrum sp. EGD-AQ16]|nr:hypothetical protein O206_19850 [Ochrobactrum sp. EGD-AQ16]
MLGLAGLLEAAKRGAAGREMRQLDIGYHRSPFAFGPTVTDVDLAAGDRAPDALLRGGRIQPPSFDLFTGPHWTLIAYEAAVGAVHGQKRPTYPPDQRQMRTGR